MITTKIALLPTLAALVALGWLLALYCAPPLCWLLLSLALATLLVLLAACMTSLAGCVCGKRLG